MPATALTPRTARQPAHAHTRVAAADLDSLPSLDTAEVLRYSRHLIIPDVGVPGQRRLKSARVLLIGAGGLGSPLALYLAAAGVGHIGLVDFDSVDVTNLQRQILHGSSGVGRPKLESARERLADLNPHIHLETYDTRLTSANALEIFDGYDVVIDGTDNFSTRYLTNDACVLLGIPNVHGSIYRFEGQASVFATRDGPCYRCLYPAPPPPGLVPSCAEGGVLGVLPGLIGTIQATEALKLLLGIGTSLAGSLLLFDALDLRIRTVQLRRNAACPACGTRTLRELTDYDAWCGVATQTPSPHSTVPEVTPGEIAARLANGDAFDFVDVREPHELDIARFPRARNVPLGALAESLGTFDASREIVVACRSGARSATAVRQLHAAGYPRAVNLAGGILRWSDDVDPTVPRY